MTKLRANYNRKLRASNSARGLADLEIGILLTQARSAKRWWLRIVVAILMNVTGIALILRLCVAVGQRKRCLVVAFGWSILPLPRCLELVSSGSFFDLAKNVL